MLIDPNSILDGEAPQLIDEWQLEPQLWNMVRRAVVIALNYRELASG